MAGGLLGSSHINAGLLGGLLGQMQPRRPVAPPPPPQRERVSGWRVLDRVLGGQTVSEGLDTERARLETEAMRPQMQARMAELRAHAQQMGPAALIAFDTNPEAFGAQLAEQYAPQVIAAGGVQSVIGNGARVSAPRDIEFGDSLVRTDPLAPAPQTLMQRGPTFAEETGRLNANNPINVAPGGRAVDPRTGEIIAEGAPRVFTAADGSDLVQEGAGQIYSNPKDAPAPDPATIARNAERAEARQRAVESERQQIASVRQTIGRAREQISGWTTGPLAGLAAIGGTPAADLAATLDTIEANLSFRALAEMRANSPTGGALGSITERELQLLGATVANLRQSQSPSQLRENLAVIERTLSEIERRSAQQAAPAPSGGVSREAALAEARRRGLIR